ncbi:MAG: DUF2813 domain-containing protein [Methanobacteriaceae archaeon]|nr:DUF2813 domain-containing protein [Methanobacteriaceae archaeon]
MVLKIKKMHIKAFRGIKDSEILLNEKSLLICGENGTGKSSIVDSIEFFFKGKVSTLKGSGITFNRHGPHTNHTQEDIKVDLTFTAENTLTRTHNSFSPIPSNYKKYFNVSQDGVFILRRKQLLSFIDNTPSERFNVISGFMGIDYLDKIEKAMKESVYDLKKGVDEKETGIQKILNNISEIVGKVITSEKEILPSLNELFKKHGLPELTSFEKAPEHSAKMFSIVKEDSDNLQNIIILKEIREKTENKVETDSHSKIKDFNIKLNDLLKENMKENMSLKLLLESGKDALEIDKLENKCPLCEEKVDKKDLISKIEERLQSFEKTSEDFLKLKEELKSISDEISNLINHGNDILNQIERFDEFKDDETNLKEKIDYLVNFQKQLKSVLDKNDQILINDFNTILDDFSDILININKKTEELISKIKITDDEKKFLDLLEVLAVAISKIKDITEYNDNLKELKSRLELIDNIYNSFIELKKSKIQSIFDSIQSDIQDFYSLLHPKEPHNNIELKIVRNASAELKITSFSRENQDPRALTSEGHLDSLGLCIFLALVNKFNKDCSLIVLDDIVTTVDSAHRQMICKLLFTQFKKKQFIITTHENLWYQQLFKSQQVFGVNFENYIISNWTVDDGPDLKPYKINLDRIYEKISSGDLSCAGNESRQYLEWVLEEICKSIDAEVLMKERYTAGDLMSPVRGQLKEIIADPDIKKEIKDAFRELENNSIMGNILSHNNLFAGNVSATEVKRFVESVKKIHDLMTCPSCGKFIQYHERAGILKCPKKCPDSVIISN